MHLLHETYNPLLGQPHFTGTSFQIATRSESHLRTVQYVDASAAAGRPWVVHVDEIGPYTTYRYRTYSVTFFVVWTLLLIVWVSLGIPVGPGAGLRLQP